MRAIEKDFRFCFSMFHFKNKNTKWKRFLNFCYDGKTQAVTTSLFILFFFFYSIKPKKTSTTAVHMCFKFFLQLTNAPDSLLNCLRRKRRRNQGGQDQREGQSMAKQPFSIDLPLFFDWFPLFCRALISTQRTLDVKCYLFIFFLDNDFLSLLSY